MEKNKFNKFNIINISFSILFFVITIIRLFNKSSIQIDNVVTEFKIFDLFIWYEYVLIFIVFLFCILVNVLFILKDFNYLNFNLEKKRRLHYEIGSIVISAVSFIGFLSLLQDRYKSANNIISYGIGDDHLKSFLFVIFAILVFILLFTLNGKSLKVSSFVFFIIALFFFAFNVLFLVSYFKAISEDNGLSQGLSVVFSIIFGFISCIFNLISLSMCIKDRRDVKTKYNFIFICLNVLIVLFNFGVVLIEFIYDK